MTAFWLFSGAGCSTRSGSPRWPKSSAHDHPTQWCPWGLDLLQEWAEAGRPSLALLVHHCGRCSVAPNSGVLAGGLPRPYSLSNHPYPVLQYVDGTLILCKADHVAAACLRKMLEDFADATGLAINFHKSCFVPMHITPDSAGDMAALLGCPISSFPQPYLGLPLSPTKLPASPFAPLIQSFDRCLSGWHASLLSSRGRLVLCNAVLNNLATYYMCSYLLPWGVLESIDKRRRAFFWTRKDSCSGARCLIA
jgi:hypothetical protein